MRSPGSTRSRPAVSGTRAVPVRGSGPRSRYAANSGGIAGPQAHGRAATGLRRTGWPGGESGWPGRWHRWRSPRGSPRRRPRRRAGRGSIGTRTRRPGRPGAAAHGRAARSEPLTDVRQPSLEPGRRRRRPARPASQARSVRRSQAIVQSWSASRRSGQVLVVRGDRRQPFEGVAEVVREEARRAHRGTAAEPPARRDLRAALGSSRATQAPSRRRTGRCRARRSIRTATGSAVRNVQRAFRPGRALSSRARPGQVAERTRRRRSGATRGDARPAARARVADATGGRPRLVRRRAARGSVAVTRR